MSVCLWVYWRFLFLRAAGVEPSANNQIRATLAGAKPRSDENSRFCTRFLLPENQKGRKTMPTKTTFTRKPIPVVTILRLSGTSEICLNKEPRPSVNGAAWENHPFRAHMVCAWPSLRIVIAEAQAHSPETMAHSRPWESPTAIRPRVNRRDMPPAPIRGCGVITHQRQLYK